MWRLLRVLQVVLILVALAVADRGAAQSLFQVGQGRAPLIEAARATPFGGATGAGLLRQGAAPLVQQSALALTDTAGLASRRSLWLGSPPPWSEWHPPDRRTLMREVDYLLDHPPRDFSQETDLVCIAVSIYHEARGQPVDGQAAVASVILNRAMDPERWGNTPCTVVIPVQFSYLTRDRRFAPIRKGKGWTEAVTIAAEVLLSGPDPRLMGADHYHATYVDPKWNRSMDMISRIKDHIFYRSKPGSRDTG